MNEPDGALLMNEAIRFLARRESLKVLDFGCGAGNLVAALVRLGHDAYGCDIGGDWRGSEQEWDRGFPADQWKGRARLSAIQASPYRLPYPDASFDVVTSTSVLEHAQNTAEVFAEIRRVLKPGGFALHLLPSKWYLPTEPHVYVPLVSWLWPAVPKIWFDIWALLGVRNEHQQGLPWRDVSRLNFDYARSGLIYLSRGRIQHIALETGNTCEWADGIYVKFAKGGVAALLRKFPWIPSRLVLQFRETLLIVRPLVGGTQ